MIQTNVEFFFTPFPPNRSRCVRARIAFASLVDRTHMKRAGSGRYVFVGFWKSSMDAYLSKINGTRRRKKKRTRQVGIITDVMSNFFFISIANGSSAFGSFAIYFRFFNATQFVWPRTVCIANQLGRRGGGFNTIIENGKNNYEEKNNLFFFHRHTVCEKICAMRNKVTTWLGPGHVWLENSFSPRTAADRVKDRRYEGRTTVFVFF